MTRRGFTLIEVMVAISILAVVATLVWSSFRQTSQTKLRIEAQAIRYRTVRIALDRMAREIAMAYLSQNEDTAQPERRTRFAGKHHGNFDELTFSYFGHQRLYEEATEGDTAVVAYTTEPSRERRGTTDLVRRETRRLGYQRPEDLAGQRDVLCDDVAKVRLEYWDSRDKQWREEWNTTTADGQIDRLPGKVKITLVARDDQNREVPFQTQTRVLMQEPLNLRAADVQAPSAPASASGSGGATKSGAPPPTRTPAPAPGATR